MGFLRLLQAIQETVGEFEPHIIITKSCTGGGSSTKPGTVGLQIAGSQDTRDQTTSCAAGARSSPRLDGAGISVSVKLGYIHQVQGFGLGGREPFSVERAFRALTMCRYARTEDKR